jgi:hypothetical protein
MGGSSQGETTPLEWYRLFRSRIEHEDNLIVQRLSWLMASQSFFFMAYAVTTNGLSSLPSGNAGRFLAQEVLLFELIPIVAIFNALLIYLSILAAWKGIRELRRAYQSQCVGNQPPPIQTRAATRSLGLSAPFLLPLLFIAVWLILLFHGLRTR